jgi:universal stress protein E
MDKLTSILVVIDPADTSFHVLLKAIVLARHFGARLELFLCDSEHAYALRHSYDPSGIERARQACLAHDRSYLESLRRSVAADDVKMDIDVACESPLYEGIVHKVLQSGPDLVIKSAAGRHPKPRFSLDANDWQLARTCPVPLMLTHGHTWAAQPKFAAAVDVSERETAGLARAIVHTAEYLSLGCHAQLELLYSERESRDLEGSNARAATLHELAREFRVGAERVHVLPGEPEVTLPAFTAQRRYDVLVLGALTHRGDLAALVGTLTNKLVDVLECDFVLVKPGTYSCPVVQPTHSDHVPLAERQRAHREASPLGAG